MAGYDKSGSLGSPRVSGSGQTDPEVEAEVSSRTGGIKAESEEKKPVVKDSEANTVKSGKTSRQSVLLSCLTSSGEIFWLLLTT